MRLAKEETKSKREIEFSYPAWLVAEFDHYMAVARPILLKRASTGSKRHLWIGRRGKEMDAEDISTHMANLTRRHLGRSVSPHLFRDCVATDIAIFDPTHIGIVKVVLGHAHPATSERFYNQATMLSASARHQATIAGLRAPKAKG